MAIAQVTAYKLSELPKLHMVKTIQSSSSQESLQYPFLRPEDRNTTPTPDQDLLPKLNTLKLPVNSLVHDLSTQHLRFQTMDQKSDPPTMDPKVDPPTPNPPTPETLDTQTSEDIPLHYHRDHTLEKDEESDCFLRTSFFKHSIIQDVSSPPEKTIAETALPRARLRKFFNTPRHNLHYHPAMTFKRYLTKPLLHLRKDVDDAPYSKPPSYKPLRSLSPSQTFPLLSYQPRTYPVEPFLFSPKELYVLRPQEPWLPKDYQKMLLSETTGRTKNPSYQSKRFTSFSVRTERL